jgi:hypothetical protein
MKIHEILVESQQLDEGPMLNKIGSGIGKFAGGAAKALGAVAGGVVGAGSAMKKGFQAGRDTVAQAGDDEAEAPATTQPAATTQGAAPAAEPVGGATAQPTAGDVNKAGPSGTAPAKPLQGAAKVAADKTAAATAGQDQAAAGQTMYAQVKANIDKLDKKGKQRILQLLQKSLTAAPAAEKPGDGAMGAMASQLGGKPANTMANAPVSATNTAKPGNPNAAPAAEPTAAPAAEPTAAPAVEPTKPGKVLRKPRALQQPAAAPAAEPTAPAAEPKKRAPRKQAAKAPTQAEIDADRERLMGVTSDSIVRRQPALAEGFSLFRKRA